ncbi:hypothetical protein CYLTODRAFT_418595 [Cylindrobasidium torrendii FP15055 ss-10]|uniref:PH domain-containing protein n=1 Tax=Cylindrobasidium torrendii FP15055 ss-10 TaxID=1314674 RepID=A0A0D7BQ31_9AGAR|nr:hypothetical protein CYLTODRAFT_418595 [Cylindrobasidium torrendii FP15055 ss-10]
MIYAVLDRVEHAEQSPAKPPLHNPSSRFSRTSLLFPDPRAMPPERASYTSDNGRAGSAKAKERALSARDATTSQSPVTPPVTAPSRGTISPERLPRRSRGSLLVVASDALGIRFGKRRAPLRVPPPPETVVFMDISASAREEAEREQLREAAAQAIGLTTSLLQPEEPPTANDAEEDVVSDPSVTQRDSVESPPVSPTMFIAPLSPTRSRHRPGSPARPTHSRASSVAPTPVPPYPSSPAALKAFIQASATLPKYHAPSSLRIFALSKQWKTRFLVMTHPVGVTVSKANPTKSYLHLFRGADPDEKELERLEINEDSVVFIANEEEVSGRRHVVKVGGIDVGAQRKELNQEEGGRTMWFLQICDQSEAQQWIARIKQSIFGQRAVRAGLGPPSSVPSGLEPRGDLDTMLSMRAQGIINSPGQRLSITEFGQRPSTSNSSEQGAPSVCSTRSNRSASSPPKPGTSSAVSTLKGLFTGSGRPRSASRAASLASEPEPDPDDSFSSMGHSLMNLPIVRPGDLDQKIISDEELAAAPRMAPPFAVPLGHRVSQVVPPSTIALQPPPSRKRWTTNGEVGTQVPIVSDQDIFHDSGSTECPANRNGEGKLLFTPQQKPREPSIQSVSTLGSVDQTSTKTKSSSMKRWSRQIPMPKRLTPPSGPPPEIPDVTHSRASIDSYNSSAYSLHSSGRNLGSGMASFNSKRASTSSAFSAISTASTTHSSNQSPEIPHSHSRATSTHSHTPSSRPSSSHRQSVPPPPRPAPTAALPAPPPASNPPDSLLRKSITSRSFRLSLMAPKPPPDSEPPLPPSEGRPRSRSVNTGAKHHLATIPSSPNPMPNRPLPAPPMPTEMPLSRRLRILSAPAPTSPITPTATTVIHPPSPHFETFMQVYSPLTPTAPVAPAALDEEPVLRSLSPPPRRMSRSVVVPPAPRESRDSSDAGGKEEQADCGRKHLSAAGSVVSLGMVTV